MSYVAFVAPALLVASAMTGAVLDSFGVFYKLRYDRLYDAMLATPIGPLEIALGEIGSAVLRGGMYAAAFLVVVVAMGLVRPSQAVLLLPVALLVAAAFASAAMAFVTFIRSVPQLDFVNIVVASSFLFSTTFYPLSVYPTPFQPLVACSPLYSGIELAREVAAGVFQPDLFGHAVYLAAIAGAGVYATSRRLRSLLMD